MFVKPFPSFSTFHRNERRGNTLVLVTGILVLLVIIATAYVTRTQAGRVTAGATLASGLRDDNARTIAGVLSQEIAESLFVREIDTAVVAPGVLASANAPRLPLFEAQVRYGRDSQDVNNDLVLDFPYNFAPYHVVPWTNWPDSLDPLGDPLLPPGPGNAGINAPLTGFLSAEGNPIGNPGFGDTRWLRDLEPLRWDAWDLLAGGVGVDGIPDAFSHWRHLTNISRSTNGWLIVRDIADVDLNLMTNLDLPFEQWLAVMPNNSANDLFNAFIGTVRFVNTNDFWLRWNSWFNDYQNTYSNPLLTPPNLYKLNDLDADGVKHNFIVGTTAQDRPESEFMPGTARNAVSRVLVDTDGDGFTDSYWFLSPLTVQNGIRQLVAISIVDNCGMLNYNVATRFHRNGDGFPVGEKKTMGLTPTDLALVGQLDRVLGATDRNSWKVGFYDNPDHDHPGGYNVAAFDYADVDDFVTVVNSRWVRHLQSVNLRSNLVPMWLTVGERLDYWRRSASQPLSADPGSLYTPFTFADEIPFRMYHGQNYPWIFTRYEQTVQSYGGNSTDNFFRAGLATTSQESSEYLYQLTNRGLLLEPRHRLTMHSAARNDIMPPWLWEVPNVPELKIDLRSAVDDAAYRQRLRNVLRRCLMDTQAGLPTAAGTYYGISTADIAKTEKLAAALAANIDQQRDADQISTISEAVEVFTDPARRFMGMEKQPFLVEAFIGHAYAAVTAQFDHPGIVAGDHVLCGDGSKSSTIVVVQIANPFETTLNLNNYKIRVFAITPDPALPLPPVQREFALTGTLAPNAARTYFAIEDDLNGDVDAELKWKTFLKLDVAGVDAVSVLSTPPLPTDWSVERTDYDSGNKKRAVELVKVDTSLAAPVDVIVDRIDVHTGTGDFEFGDKVKMLPPPAFGSCAEPPAAQPWDQVLNIGERTNFAQWVHVTRAWEYDFDGIAGIDPTERNPRFIFADREVDVFDGDTYLNADPVASWFPPGVVPAKFERTDKGFHGVNDATGVPRLNFPLQMLQKEAEYLQIGEALNAWMYGHELRMNGSDLDILQQDDGGTPTTFSEFIGTGNSVATDHFDLAGRDFRVNRLRTVPTDIDPPPPPLPTPPPPPTAPAGLVVGIGDPGNLSDPRHAMPALPAGVRMLDAFVCDGAGLYGNASGAIGELLNAKRFDGTGTPGMINLNTAPPEVMHCIPHWYRLVHVSGMDPTFMVRYFDDSPSYVVPAQPRIPLVTDVNNPPNSRLPRSMVAEALLTYRERGDGVSTGYPNGPNYSGRGNPPADPFAFIANMRGARGIASIGEVNLLVQRGQNVIGAPELIIPEQWRIDLDLGPRVNATTGMPVPGFVPLVEDDPASPTGAKPVSIRISTEDERDRDCNGNGIADVLDIINGTSTDVQNGVSDGIPDECQIAPNPAGYLPVRIDDVAGDAEEANLLFAGASNMITTRSDTFTVYFRVRSFRQNTSVSPPVWDATNPEYIVDDSRYVMLVDRSTVNKPGDKPKILYMEKLPN